MATEGMNDEQAHWLLALARESIAGALTGKALPQPDQRPAGVDAPAASFVTLTLDGQLRGCIGSLHASRPLWHDVAENARSAAFRDPRFAPLTLDELEQTLISVSVLDTPEPLTPGDRAHLKAQLRPGADGLTVTAGEHRATFLPSVWQQLPDADDFIDQLKRKAGLPPTFPDRQLICERYRVSTCSERADTAGSTTSP